MTIASNDRLIICAAHVWRILILQMLGVACFSRMPRPPYIAKELFKFESVNT